MGFKAIRRNLTGAEIEAALRAGAELWGEDGDPRDVLSQVQKDALEKVRLLIWEEEAASSASRQHYIDTGRYLPADDYDPGPEVDDQGGMSEVPYPEPAP